MLRGGGGVGLGVVNSVALHDMILSRLLKVERAYVLKRYNLQNREEKSTAL